jgi:lipopolysaccharide export system permease protein
MKKAIFKKLYSDTFNFFLTSLIIMGLIVWVIQAVNYFDFVTEDGHGLKVYFLYSIMNIPKIIDRILPFIFFISLFYIILNYEKRNELNIYWINGITKHEFLNKIILFSTFVMLFQLVLSGYLSPFSQLKARDYIKNSNVDFFTSLIKEGKFINVAKNITIFINKEEKDGSYSDIFMEDSRSKDLQMIYAKKGYLLDDLGNKAFKLFDGKVVNKKNTNLSVFEFDEINFNFNNLSSKSIIKPKIQEINTLSLINCIINDSNEKSLIFNCEDSIKVEIKKELFKRIFKPIYIPLLSLISAFLILNSKYNLNYKIFNFLVFIFSFLILVLSEASTKYVLSSKALTIASLLLPIMLLVILYLIFIKILKNA